MFNKRDRRCDAVQLMLSIDPSYDNRTIASTLKMQIRTVQCAQGDENKVSGHGYGLWCGFKSEPTSCHLTSSKSAWESTPKCTWMCWRVWWSPGAIRWLVADPGWGSRTWRWPTSPKRPRLGFRRSATTLYPSLTGPPPPPTWTCWTTSFGHTSRTSPTSHSTKASLIAAIRRVFAELPPALVEKACSQFQIRIEAVIEAEGRYIEYILYI